jgi:predicted kinase
VDASFLSASHRQLARQTAERSGAKFALVRTVASEIELRKRLKHRAESTSVSEADIAVLRHQLDSADPLAAAEMDSAITVDTEEEVDIQELTSELRGIAAKASAELS